VANWYTATNVIDNIPNGYIPGDLVSPAPGATSRSQFLTTRTGDGFGTWRYFDPAVDISAGSVNGDRLIANSVPVTKLIGSSGSGDYLSSVGGIPTWTAFPTAQVVTKYASTPTALPAAGNAITPLNHGLGGQPINVYGVLVCDTAEHGYVKYDEVPLDQFSTTNSDNEFAVFAMHATSTQIHCVRASDASFVTLNASNGNLVNITPGNWLIKFYAIK
jgi:hypothetical protein